LFYFFRASSCGFVDELSALKMSDWYNEDLAYIHDTGHSDFALRSAPGILQILRRNGIHSGLIVDLGCGSGLLAQELTKAGYELLGIDFSEAMLRIARRRAPQAKFRAGSLFTAELPPCHAVTATGECLNYLFDSDHRRPRLAQLFRRVFAALSPGGVFIFDIAEPGQVAPGVSRSFVEGPDWMVALEKTEDRRQALLTRRIISFRRVGKHYRRSDELHRLQLFRVSDVARELRRAGFRVRLLRSYGEDELPRAHAAFVARKPA
jgi:SAM-dependent methyltransferase